MSYRMIAKVLNLFWCQGMVDLEGKVSMRLSPVGDRVLSVGAECGSIVGHDQGNCSNYRENGCF